MPDFRPLPLLGNPHLQTLLGTFLRGAPLHRPSVKRLVHLPDGDRLVLHDSQPGRWQPGDRIAVLVHGLTGSHRSGYLQRVAGLLLPHGIRVVRLDLRGAGHGMNLARRPYHAGCSDDVRAALAEIHSWSPASPLLLLGFSLGGNIALKLAGEERDHPVPGLHAVAAVGPPIDLECCSVLLAQPRNRFYELHFVRDLLVRAKRRQELFPDGPRMRFPPIKKLTLPHFDDLYTAPRWGFAGVKDYYRRASALPYIPRIDVPALLLTARDDPIIAVEPFESLAKLPHVEVQIVPNGGHLGFLAWEGAGIIRWAERRIVEWVLNQ